MDSPRSSVRATVLFRLAAGGALIVAAFGLGLWVFLRSDAPFTVDLWWNGVVAEMSSPFLTGFALVMNGLGGGWIGVVAVPLACAVALIMVRRPWAAAFFLAASLASAGLVQVLKHLFGRVRPEDIVVVSDYGSYPSGHVANAATIAACAAILFPRAWVVLVGSAWVLLMAFSRTYLHAHWLTDTVGGALAGVGAALIVAAAFAVSLAKERGPDEVAARR